MPTSHGTRTRPAMPASSTALALSLLIAPAASAQSEPLSKPTQLTFPDRFLRAGEAYFNPAATWIIFQAIPNPKANTNTTPDPAQDPVPQATPDNAYRMYVARLRRDAQGNPTGIEEPIQVSPASAANTCGYFNPLQPERIIFASTLTPPADQAPAGYQRGTSTYAWKFPTEMEVVTRLVPQIAYDGKPKLTDDVQPAEMEPDATPLWTRPGYDAECAYAPNARHIVYTRVDPETLDPDIYIYDTKTSTHRPLIVQPGYDGGPFFSPEGSMICYRSDRKQNDLLQVFVAELAFDDQGAILGVKRQIPVTDDDNVNWAPFWHPSGEYLLFTTSIQGHANYEIYAIEAPIGIREGVLPADLKRRRVTTSPGFDGLPAFNATGDLLLWTSQRGPKRPDEDRPSSQLWIAQTADLAP